MKNLTLLIIIVFSSIFANASGPCARPSDGTIIKVPVTDINGANNIKGNKSFIGNGAIQTGVNFDGSDYIFSGNQQVKATLNFKPGQIVFIEQDVTFDYITSAGGATFIVADGSTLRIKAATVNNGNNKVILQNGTGRVIYEGKEYKVGDYCFGNKIEACSGALPVVWGKIYSEYYNGALVVGWTVEQEKNNSYFMIEISKDGNTFNEVKRVKSLGDIEGERLYTESISLKAAYVFAIAFLLLPLGRKKWMRLFIIPAVVLLVVACKKEHSAQGEKARFIRIVQVDKDGTQSASKVVTIKNY